MSGPARERYIPAAGRAWLTALYDPAMALTMRERAFRGAALSAVLVHPSPRLVLDVGCGTGTLAVQLADADAQLEVVGVDCDEKVLSRARSKAAGLDGRVRFERAAASELPVATGSVDVVIASLLLHHLLPNVKLLVLQEARRVLTPTGRLVIVDWGRPRDPVVRASFYLLQMLDGFPNTRDHAAGRLPSLIEDAGFDSVKVMRRWRTVWGSLELISGAQGASLA
ncbi:MAG: class I SAM-dependent methyltransferase [Solirubrobacteraceae bacterium]